MLDSYNYPVNDLKRNFILLSSTICGRFIILDINKKKDVWLKKTNK